MLQPPAARSEALVPMTMAMRLQIGQRAQVAYELALDGEVSALSETGDADGDGTLDLAYADPARGLVRWDDTPEGQVLEDWVGELDPTLADVNADGFDDLLVVTRDGTGAGWLEVRLGAETDAWTTATWTVALGVTARESWPGSVLRIATTCSAGV